jgi:alanyl-tRNA synthetase
MMGNQVFNYPGDFKYFKDESIEYNYRWLTETLEIDPDEITFVEDVWAGGGNLGPSIEYFVRGLEVGNMVFMQYKTFHDGTREELDIKIIDTGIGLERIAWLYNGSATSYMDTFANAMEYLQSLINLPINNDIWEKFGPYSCVLNIDEVDNVDDCWKRVADLMGEDVQKVKDSIQDVRDLYIILDHTRSILLTISDGSLPSNVGGGGNVRNILRRCFAILHKNDWWKLVGIDNFLKIFEMHKVDLHGVYGDFPEYKSFNDIIKVEYERWQTTDEAQAKQLEGLLKKKKNKLTIDDWIVCIQSYGIAPDKVAQISK